MDLPALPNHVLPMASGELKACCATFYEHDVVALVLGPHFHPGGKALTRTLGERLNLGPSDRVLDVASGTGATAALLHAEFGCEVVGVDLGAANVEAARLAHADVAGVSFEVGDAEALPFEDASFDVVVSECAVCTFPDKGQAVAEFARVLKPGGRVGITDVTADHDRLDDELRDAMAWVACVAAALPARGYVNLFEAAGFSNIRSEAHDASVAEMLDRIDARLGVLAMLRDPALAEIDIPNVRRLVRKGHAEAVAGVLGYGLFTAAR